MNRIGRVLGLGLLAWGVGVTPIPGAVPVQRTFESDVSGDQDDMCIWVHPTDPALSTVISSDKGTGNVFVYDLDGSLLQTVPSPMPGNIDLRYGIVVGGECVDLVALNDRVDGTFRVYRVDPVTRLLQRVDDGNILTGGNYGMTLFRHEDGALRAITGPQSGDTLRQFELVDDGTGQITGAPTGWEFSATITEGMVGDDETGWVYLGEENVGIWRVRIDDDLDRTLIAEVGDASGLTADVEGVTLYHGAGGAGYLIASSQAVGKFTVIDREPPHAPVGEFTIDDVGNTDGIDVVNVALGATFPQGMFTSHDGDGSGCCPVEAVRWDDIVAEVPGLQIDTTSWHPRSGCGPVLEPSRTALSWSAASPASSYSVLRGDLATLRQSAGDFAVSVTDCLAGELEQLALAYAGEPAAGDVEWYLVRGEAGFGSLSYDSYGRSQMASRDPGIQASIHSCP